MKMWKFCLLVTILCVKILAQDEPDAEVLPDQNVPPQPLSPQDAENSPPAGSNPIPIGPRNDSDSGGDKNNDVVVFDKTEIVLKKDKAGKYVIDYGPDYDPMTSEYAPPENSQRGGSGLPYVIDTERLRFIRTLFMYPYYDKGGNVDNEGDYQKAIQTSSPTLFKNLNFQLPFFGFRYNYTRISLNGYLEFSDPPVNYDQYPLVFPVKDWPKQRDPAFIGIFYSKCRIGNLRDEDIDRRKPGVYFRMERDLRQRVDQMGVEIRERLKWDLRTGVIGADHFNPKHALIITWKNVSFTGGFANAVYRTNTFQMVLATDEVYTYAIFNYLNLDWTTHTEAGGDTMNGEGGVPALIGFNGGNGTRSYEYMPYSQNSVLRDVTSTGFGNGFPGRHIFRIDEDILTGSCNRDIDGTELKLFFAPESGNMLGGTLVNVKK